MRTDSPNLNFTKIFSQAEEKDIITIINHKLKVVNLLAEKESKINALADLFDYIFSNYQIVDKNPKFKEMMVKKSVEYEDDFIPTDLLSENPFSRWRLLLE